MARGRAIESARPDPLVSDPWARGLVEAALAAVPMSDGLPSHLRADGAVGDIVSTMTGYVALRTRWLDDATLAAVRAGAQQVVLLGAGLDTRALRLSWPRPVTVFAVDQPGVVAFARHALAGAEPHPQARSVPVPVDLTGPWTGTLRDAGFTADLPTAWVAEGLLMYLHPEQVDALLADVRELSAAGGTLLADLIHPDAQRGSLFAPELQMLQDNGSPISSAVADPVAWYAARGWTGDVVDTVALAGGYGRDVPPVVDPRAPGGPTFWFTEARR